MVLTHPGMMISGVGLRISNPTLQVKSHKSRSKSSLPGFVVAELGALGASVQG